MHKVAVKFLGTTAVIAPIVLIILTIWMAFASPANSKTLAEDNTPLFQFLKAAAFFLYGTEQADYVVGTEHNGTKSTAKNGVQDQMRKVGFMVDADGDPCVVRVLDFGSQLTDLQLKGGGSKLFKIRHVNFRKMPSPRVFSMSHTSGFWASPRLVITEWTVTDLPSGAICESGYNTRSQEYTDMKCFKGWTWTDSGTDGNTAYRAARRLKALDYIRNNFCAGLPEPNGY